MINEELYNRSVDVLVQAYFNDTLEYTDTCACGVGNLVAAACGYKVEKGPRWFVWDKGNARERWSTVFLGGTLSDEERWDREGVRQLETTGYSVLELLSIEQSFSKGISQYCKQNFQVYRATDEQNFAGLMSIIETLDQIHQNTNPATTEAAKRKFSPSVL